MTLRLTLGASTLKEIYIAFSMEALREKINKESLMRKTIFVFCLFVLSMNIVCACSPTSNVSSAPVAVKNPIPTVVVSVQENEEIPDDCVFEGRTLSDGTYEYRSSCGKGWFVYYSHALHRGGPQDPGITVLYISVIEVKNSNWNVKPDNLDWIALFGTPEEAKKTACDAVKEGRAVVPGSEWILPCK